MDVRPLRDPAAFLEAAGPLLLEDEARHNLILGLAATLRDSPALYPDFGLWIVEHDGDPVERIGYRRVCESAHVVFDA